jgi:triphosphoribosyl-dephospho-CoA synthase
MAARRAAGAMRRSSRRPSDRASGRIALIAAAAQAACLLEVLAPKPGNVGRGRDLPGLTYRDFVLSAYAVGPAFREHLGERVGRLILEAVRRTRRQVRTNTNLGIVLLLAPLARASLESRGAFRDRLRRVLLALDVRDARDAYRAIRLAEAGGLGKVEAQDVRSAPTLSLLECMRLAAGRDAVAREYATGFETSLTVGLPMLRRLRDRHVPLPVAIAQTYLALLAAAPDTLVVRRHGADKARALRQRARVVVEAGGFLTERGRAMAERLDRDLRAARPPRNPGATADLTVASLFLWLLDDQGLLGRIATAPRRRRRGSSRVR